MNWEKKLETILRASMRYCFRLPDGQFPEMDEEEFANAENGGFLGFVRSAVLGMRKRAYLDGYLRGVMDYALSTPEEQRILNNMNAETRWCEYERDGN